MNPELYDAIERARKITMTEEQRDEQAISFAYGNLAIENPNTTREGVEAAFRRLKEEARKQNEIRNLAGSPV